MKLGKSLECERLSSETQPRDGYIRRPQSLGCFRAEWRSRLSLDVGAASGRRGAGGRGQGDSVLGRSSMAEHSPARRGAAYQPASSPPPLLPVSSRVSPAEHLAVTSISQGTISLWQAKSPDLGLEVRKQEKRFGPLGVVQSPKQ